LAHIASDDLAGEVQSENAMKQPNTKLRIDPRSISAITLELTHNALLSICEEMMTAIVRSSRSPQITERRDCSCSLYTPAGEMVVQAQHVPIHLGIMPRAVRAVIEQFETVTMEAGQAFVVNDPYHGANHLPDLIVVGPLFIEGTLVGFAATMAHHNDVGGVAPRSMPADATEIFQEGLRLPPILLAHHGHVVDDIARIIALNSRKPQERIVDLDAQLATIWLAETRIREVVGTGKSGALVDDAEALMAIEHELLARSERAMRARLMALPDGNSTHSVEASTGLAEPGLVEIRVRVTKTKDRLVFDFAGTGPQVPSPFNACAANTYAAVLAALRMTLAAGLPASEGLYRCVEINSDVGTIVNPRYPAAISAATQVSAHTFDAVVGALEVLAPGCGIAESGSAGVFSFGGYDDARGEAFVFGTAIPGGLGATVSSDGQSAVPLPVSNTQNTPVEVRETELPIRILEYSLLRESRGIGTHSGGMGVREVTEFLAPATCSLQLAMGVRGPQGSAGGSAAAPARVVHTGRSGNREIVTSLSWAVEPGDSVQIDSPGGGGWGPAASERRDDAG
jgi:N-methylhydantoinase B